MCFHHCRSLGIGFIHGSKRYCTEWLKTRLPAQNGQQGDAVQIQQFCEFIKQNADVEVEVWIYRTKDIRKVQKRETMPVKYAANSKPKKPLCKRKIIFPLIMEKSKGKYSAILPDDDMNYFSCGGDRSTRFSLLRGLDKREWENTHTGSIAKRLVSNVLPKEDFNEFTSGPSGIKRRKLEVSSPCPSMAATVNQEKSASDIVVDLRKIVKGMMGVDQLPENLKGKINLMREILGLS